MSFKIEIYEKTNGDMPFFNYLQRLRSGEVAKILRDIDLLEKYGNELREPYSKYLGRDLFELRTKFGRNIFRIIYFFIKGNTIVITHCFQKKQNKTPNSEMNLALKYKADWERRYRDAI